MSWFLFEPESTLWPPIFLRLDSALDTRWAMDGTDLDIDDASFCAVLLYKKGWSLIALVTLTNTYTITTASTSMSKHRRRFQRRPITKSIVGLLTTNWIPWAHAKTKTKFDLEQLDRACDTLISSAPRTISYYYSISFFLKKIILSRLGWLWARFSSCHR